MQTLEQIEQDIIRRVFDESFLNEKLLTKLLHAYGAARAAAERERCIRHATHYLISHADHPVNAAGLAEAMGED